MKMRVLVQQIETGLYFQDPGSWTANPQDAVDFLSSAKAVDFCAARGISGVQLVLKFEEQQYDIVLPILGKQSGPRSRARGSP